MPNVFASFTLPGNGRFLPVRRSLFRRTVKKRQNFPETTENRLISRIFSLICHVFDGFPGSLVFSPKKYKKCAGIRRMIFIFYCFRVFFERLPASAYFGGVIPLSHIFQSFTFLPFLRILRRFRKKGFACVFSVGGRGGGHRNAGQPDGAAASVFQFRVSFPLFGFSFTFLFSFTLFAFLPAKENKSSRRT